MTALCEKNRIGYMGYTLLEIYSMENVGSSLGVYNGLVYDLTDYVNYGPSVEGPNGEVAVGGINAQFMHNSLVNLFKYSSDQDLANAIDNLSIDFGTLAAQKTCLMMVWTTQTLPVSIPAVLLVPSIMMANIIAFKSIASTNFSSPRVPQDHDKFVIFQVPCYTEGDVSLRLTID